MIMRYILEMMKTKDAVSEILGYEASLFFYSLADSENIEEIEKHLEHARKIIESGMI